ncbi:hypothetical protein CF67_08014 [Candidatus Photodesmus blepharus]|uniref:Lipoprotein n=1 Tax=Candidatus Photodesmus blepharonis TaxID=1179155 RepID=A0A084CM95_9GAMM|nr:hypothetical protein [Candidatus Photodesmus blepharus]KEY90924.1 hypothetical protein CF67_08014 [Candidatus Photodesmus blepharus]
MKIKWITFIFIAFLIGCNADIEPEELVTFSSEKSEITNRAISDLIVPDGFNYHAILEYNFDVDISAYSTQRAYLSVYGDFFTAEDGSYIPNFNSRIISASLENGKKTLKFYITDLQTSALAEVWFYDGLTPIQHKFTTSQNSWVW